MTTFPSRGKRKSPLGKLPEKKLRPNPTETMDLKLDEIFLASKTKLRSPDSRFEVRFKRAKELRSAYSDGTLPDRKQLSNAIIFSIARVDKSEGRDEVRRFLLSWMEDRSVKAANCEGRGPDNRFHSAVR